MSWTAIGCETNGRAEGDGASGPVGIDRARAREAFAGYVRPYDASDPKIALKVKHTYKVAEIGERIARSLELSAADVDLAWLCCLLHDIGRFEQLRRWGTFRDGLSASHARLGVEALYGDSSAAAPNALELPGAAPVEHPAEAGAPGSGRIESFCSDPAAAEVVYQAVLWHSAFRVPVELDDRTRMFIDIVRDADKVDIFRASGFENSPEVVMETSEEDFLASEVSAPAYKAFMEHRSLSREERLTPLDLHVGTVALAYELVYPESRRIALEQGYLERDLATPFGITKPFDREDTRRTWAAMGDHLRAWLRERA